VELIAEVPTQPSGLGWLPDGRLLVVSMLDRRVLRQEADGTLVTHADLSGVATGQTNDMLVDPHGRAYVGNFGYDPEAGEELASAALALVHPDGRVEQVADDLAFPNGMVLLDDGATLVVAETFGAGLTAFDVDPAGRLGNRRLWASLDGAHADGICADAAGGIWVATPPCCEAIRVVEGGEATDRVTTRRPCIAVALGGDDGRTLFSCTSAWADPSTRDDDTFGLLETVRVDHPALA
jgi:sugar lactone lactonase YvrE